MTMDRQEILGLNVESLKKKLGELGLGTTGRKEELRDRLIEHFGLSAEDSGSEYNDVGSRQEGAGGFARNLFTLRDIEDSLSAFCGTDNIEIHNWIDDFEDNAEAVGWNELQRFIYAKQLLKGAARMFIRSQNGIKSWKLLKESLIVEFGTKIPAIEVHKMLRNRKKKGNETYREYLYTLIEMGKPINLDEESLIQYFVDGIPDSKFGKSILYQARDVNDLKDRLRTYEKIREPSQQASTSKATSESTMQGQTKHVLKERRKCYKCGGENHLAKECNFNNIKCFQCGKLGHKSFECKNLTNAHIKSEKNNSCMVGKLVDGIWRPKSTTNRNFKEIKINGVKLSAIVDSGSDISIVRHDVFQDLGDVNFIKNEQSFITAGDYKLRCNGYFEKTVSMDGVDFNLKFFVAKNLIYPAVIGNDILEQADIMLTSNGATFVKNKNGKTESAISCEIADEFRHFCSVVTTDDEGEQFDLSHLSKERETEIKALVRNYSPERKEPSPIEMKIILSDDIPIFQRPRRLSYADHHIVEQQMEDWLRDGIISPSSSEYASPIVLVNKRDGSKRLCCDYRKLNEKIIRDNFPMVLIDDIVHKLQSANIFTTLDLRNGFFHVPVEEKSRRYTSFVTHNGQYEFLYVPFGISNSPAVFSRFIFSIYRELIQNGTIIVYVDDIIIPSANEEEGIEKLEKVLNVAAKYGLQIKWQKCQFLQKRVKFLGYIVENSTIKPSAENTAAVANFPIPTDKKSLQQFLGLTSYFRRFICNYAVIARPLSDLMKKDAVFEMKDTQLIAFKQLKSALMSSPVLNLYNPKAITEVHTDASMYGYGAVLLQKNSEDQQLHPVEYMSRKTTDAQRKYHSYELEVLAIIEALKKWRVYLIGNKIKIVTDCNAFAMTIKKKDVPLRVSRWAMYLQEFDFVIEHRSGSKMRHVDALSRVSCLLVADSLKHRLKEAQLRDEWIRAVRKALEKDTYEDFYLKHDLLYKDQNRELIVIPSCMEEEIIQIAHREAHFGIKKTRDLLEREFYIPDIAAKVEKVVRSCIECIMSEAKTGKSEGLLNPIDKSDRPLRTYHIDHVGPMDQTPKRYNHIFLVVDSFSKFIWLYPTRSTGTEEVLDRLKRQSAIFGHPERIISDRGTAFTSNSFQEYCSENGIQHLLIATGVPRGNGQVERINKIVISLLTKLSSEKPQQWYRYVEKVQQCINNTPPRSTKVSPFKILTGMEMRTGKHEDIRKMIEEFSLEEIDNERNEIREIAKENIAKIQEENRKTFNKRRIIAPVYSKNDLVAIKRTQFGPGLKLKPRYFGPYKILRVLNNDRYEVEKIGEGEGPRRTITVAEYIKKLNQSFGSKDCAGGPNVGLENNGRVTRSGRTY